MATYLPSFSKVLLILVVHLGVDLPVGGLQLSLTRPLVARKHREERILVNGLM